VAFTDDDAALTKTAVLSVSDLLRGEFAAVGGHNFLPPEDSL
jgi:hypothetical protein